MLHLVAHFLYQTFVLNLASVTCSFNLTHFHFLQKGRVKLTLWFKTWQVQSKDRIKNEIGREETAIYILLKESEEKLLEWFGHVKRIHTQGY
jgi:hypothetical protein